MYDASALLMKIPDNCCVYFFSRVLVISGSDIMCSEYLIILPKKKLKKLPLDGQRSREKDVDSIVAIYIVILSFCKMNVPI